MELNITYEWKIDELICENFVVANNPNVVKAVSWTATASTTVDEKVYKTSINGKRNIVYSNSSTFIPYENLTPEQVLEWVWSVPATIGSTVDPHNTPRTRVNNKIRTEAQLKSQLEKMIVPEELKLPLPWLAN